jgi:hypothetical protein
MLLDRGLLSKFGLERRAITGSTVLPTMGAEILRCAQNDQRRVVQNDQRWLLLNEARRIVLTNSALR